MQVKWELQHTGVNGRGDRWTAYLVDPEKDAPEKTVARIGSIEIRFLEVKVRCTREFHQGLFWMKAWDNLDRLALSPVERGAIEAQLSDRIPKPGDDWALWGVTCIPRFEP